MLILRVPRWGSVQPFLADEALVNGAFVGVDEEPPPLPRPWPVPQRAAHLADEDVLPLLGLEHGEWVPPAPWDPRYTQWLPAEGDQLPPRGLEHDDWQPPAPWPLPPPILLWWEDGDGYPTQPVEFGLDEDAWHPLPPRPWSLGGVLWWDDGNGYPTQPDVFGLDEEGWQWAPAWLPWSRPPIWGDDLTPPQLSIDEEPWQWAPAWAPWGRLLAWDDENELPQFRLDEEWWLPPGPWQEGFQRLQVDESEGLPSELRITEEYWLQFPAWPPTWPRRALTDTDALVQGAYFFLFDDAWRPPLPWPIPQRQAAWEASEWVQFVAPPQVIFAEFEEELMAGTPTLWTYDTIAEDLDWCQAFLKDTRIPGTDGDIWTREELLLWYQDGYRNLLRDAETTRRLSILHVPPQWTATGTWEWELPYAYGGTFQQWTVGHRTGLAAGSLWELEVEGGYPATSGSGAITHGWERAYLNPPYTPFRFGLSRNHLRIQKMWYDHVLLQPVDVRALDWTYRNWVSLAGEPMAWTMGTGDIRSYELFEIQTVPTQDYRLQRGLGDSDGLLRHLSGVRTYQIDYDDDTPATVGFAYTTQGESMALSRLALQSLTEGPGLRLTGEPTFAGYQAVFPWEAQVVEGSTPGASTAAVSSFAWEAAYGAAVIHLCPGLIRHISSPDRQYWPVVYEVDQLPLGKIDDLRSSHDALLCLEVIEPDTPELLEQDLPGMLPPQMQKYLKYYTLARAFNRQGEGYQPALASVWLMRYQAGARMLRFMKMIQRRDTQKSRVPVETRGRPPRPRLPGTYPQGRD